MTALNLESRGYTGFIKENFQDPTNFLIDLIGLHNFKDFIHKNKDGTLPVLTGIVVYRQLGHIEKQKVLRLANELGNPRFTEKVRMLTATLAVNPYWTPWSLSQEELREFFNHNNSIVKFLSTYFFTIDVKLEVQHVAAGIFGLASLGVANHLKDQAGLNIFGSIFQKVPKGALTQYASRAFLVAVIMASVIKKFSEADAKAAKEELLRRGLLKVSDL